MSELYKKIAAAPDTLTWSDAVKYSEECMSSIDNSVPKVIIGSLFSSEIKRTVCMRDKVVSEKLSAFCQQYVDLVSLLDSKSPYASKSPEQNFSAFLVRVMRTP